MTDPRVPTPPRLPDELPVAAEPIRSDATVSGLAYADLDLSGAAFELTEVDECRFAASRWAASTWRRCVIGDAVVDECDLGNVAMTDCGWQRVAVARSRLTGIDLSGCTVQNVRLTGCAVDLSNWRFATLRRVVFDGCKVTGGDFASASLTDVRFVDCNLTGADFREVTLDRVRFEACVLDGIGGVTSLAGATIDPLDLVGLGYQLASALGIAIAPAGAHIPE
ncbi:pentapeptide repeat-containing protein [Solicola gregarius]|uniref:Pentapeptide repeat-containing protein n=1 Tax=Solicola gregarius TaxID=2908642 RepID=A0AA46TIT2_9ACTN|nr:pentapeptide repeat-containing protein [Solicola gregarius]UYM05991.1 pentapeptide repeat-containing protein [Solicola gregarius]